MGKQHQRPRTKTVVLEDKRYGKSIYLVCIIKRQRNMSAKFPYQRFYTETYRVLEICDKIFPVLKLLEPSKGHLRARDVLLRVLEVFDQRLLVPGDPLRDIRLRVREALRLASLTTEEAICRRKHKIVLGGTYMRRGEWERTRAGSVRPCEVHQPQQCGTGHSGS